MVTDTDGSARRVLLVSAAVGSAVCAILLWLLYGRSIETGNDRLEWLPVFNAFCNALSAVCLTIGFRAIRERRISTHRRWMLTAVGFSVLFLVGYVTHHAIHGDTKFGGSGAVRPLYFALLVSHVGLSVLALPMVLSTLWFAATRRFAIHKRIARFTFPIWLYVSVTGVAVFLFLRAYR